MKIYCDLDGVLVDFVRGALKAHGLDYEKTMSRWPLGEWSITNALKMKSNRFWEPLNTKYFWKTLEWIPMGRELLATLKEFDAKTRILTTPSASYNCNIGKILWAEANGICNRNGMLLYANKYEFAQRGSILIDDSDRNCNLWRDNGGTAILFPQIWNSHGAAYPKPSDKYSYVLDQLNGVT